MAEAAAGSPLLPGIPPAGEDAVIAALRTLYDPEIPVNLYDLGLIYTLDIGPGGNVAVVMTLTAPSCPVAAAIPQQVADTLAAIPGIGEVSVDLVWDPPWTLERLSEDARLALGV